MTTNASNSGRIISGVSNNWLLGFWSNFEDQCFYTTWLYGTGAGAPFNVSPLRSLSRKLYVGRGTTSDTNGLFRRNGITLRSGSMANDGPGGLILGGGTVSASLFTEVSSSDIYEVIVYNRALSDTEIFQIEKYLANKWEISLAVNSITSPVISGSIPTIDFPKYSNESLFFSDDTSYVDTGKKWSDFTSQTSSLSFTTWIRPWRKTLGASHGSVFHQLQNLTVPNTSSRGGFQLRISESLHATLDYGTNTFSHSITSATPIPFGKWSHIAGVRSGRSQSLYINGALSSTSVFTSASWLNAPATNIVMGRGWGNNQFKFNGDIGTLQLYNSILSAADVSSSYEQYKSKYINESYPSLVTDGLVIYINPNNVGSYPKSGNVIYNLTGSQHFNFTSSGITSGSEIKSMICSNSFGLLKRSGSISTLLGGNVTLISWAIPSTGTADWRTLYRGSAAGDDHHFIVEMGSHRIGFYDAGGGAFISSGYNITSISNYEHEYNSYETILSSTSPHWSFYLNGETAPRATIINTLISSSNFDIGTFGGYSSLQDVPDPRTGSSQYFGTIGCILVYNRKLTDEERLRNYLYLKKMFSK
jgi:hypothetical protein